ncbi:MAG: hypothetical protein D3904_02805 [Candidatus Electrothrix sp. EH2]|nr:hypothetical protein [Candidatus Electrothrix sp. EH2]
MKKLFFLLLGSALLFSASAGAGNISVQVVADQGYIFPQYPVSASPGNYRAYVQAQHNARYGLRIRNHTRKRIGLVVAVDGRNIISGKKSYLRNTEKMYVLAPDGVAVYRGWRTGRDEIHRFYFTDPGDSYAEAWGDQSAMGVIAVAAFAEKRQQIVQPVARPRLYSAPAARESGTANSRAGTGYGEGEYSSSVRVDFHPKPYPLEKHFYKYEWRETLCRKRIISCPPSPSPRPPHNRFWPDDDGYAPPPPR